MVRYSNCLMFLISIFRCAKERKVDEEISCLRQLLHWNDSPAEGRGKTHAAIVHRLRQLHRDDLADWLGKTAFEQLGKNLNTAIETPLEESTEEEMETIASALFHIINSRLCKITSKYVLCTKCKKYFLYRNILSIASSCLLSAVLFAQLLLARM